MRLFAGYDLLQTDAGPSGLAYNALLRAGVRPDVVYVGRSGRRELEAATRQSCTPAVVTPSGEVIASVPGIVAWATGAARA